MRQGAYQRLEAALIDEHAALKEVGGIYAEPEIHEGWQIWKETLGTGLEECHNGIIQLGKAQSSPSLGNHAFVIVGYNDEGFLVLNSWGRDWGLYDPPGKTKGAGRAGYPGIALWRYQDWAERILDGWVLRLGVTAPEGFKYSFGPQGLAGFASGQITAATTPRHELVGHYIHLNDGKLVEDGTLPSTKRSLDATCKLISKRYSVRDAPPVEPYTKETKTI